MTRTMMISGASVCSILGILVGSYFPTLEASKDQALAKGTDAEVLDVPLESDPVKVDRRRAGEAVLDYELRSVSWIHELAQWNPRRAFVAAILHLEETGESTQLTHVMATWGATDAASAIEAFRTLTAEQQSVVLPGLAEAIVTENPNGAIHLFESGVIEKCHNDLIGRAFSLFGSDHPDNAARWVREKPEISSNIENVLEPFLRVSGGLETFIDVFGADFSSHVANSHEYLLFSLNTRFADVSEAMAFAETINDPDAKAVYNMAIARDLLKTDSVAAADFMTSALSPSQLKEAAPYFAKLLSATDLDQALEFAERTVPDDQINVLKSEIFRVDSLYGNLLSEEHAMEFIELINAGNLDVQSAMMTLSQEISAGTRGWEWIEKIEDDENPLKRAGLDMMAYRYMEIDPRVSSEVLVTYPEGEGRDIWVSTLVGSISDDPERALQWTSLIGDRDIRASTLDRVIGVLSDYSSDDVLDWLTNAPLTIDEQTLIRNAIVPEDHLK